MPYTLAVVLFLGCGGQDPALPQPHDAPIRSAPQPLTPMPAPIEIAPSFPPGQLEISPTEATTPALFTVTGPPHFIANGKNEYHGWGGCQYSVSWGDRTRTQVEQDCSAHLRHTYKTPGTYTVIGNIYHLGPDDRPIIDWSSRAEAVVLPSGKERDRVTLTTPLAPRYSYAKLPLLELEVELKKPAHLNVALKDSKGRVIRYSEADLVGGGSQRIYLDHTNKDALNDALVDPHNQYRVHYELSRDGKVKALGKSTSFLLDAMVINTSHGALAVVEVSERKVRLEYSSRRAGCVQYTVDWGDGHKKSYGEDRRGSCEQKSSNKIIQHHTYETPGEYTVRVYGFDSSPSAFHQTTVLATLDE